jgi:hypothetical protein
VKRCPAAIPPWSPFRTVRPSLWRYLTVTACVLLYSVPFLRVLTLRVDEGWCLTDAARVYHGQLPYRDFFEFVGPVTFYWIALFFHLFGETWMATRICVLVLGTATAVLVYFIARRLKPGSEIMALIFWLAILFPTWPAVNHHLIANLFALGAFALLLWWLDGAHNMVLVLCGIAVGVTFATMFPKGLALSAAFVVIVLLRDHRHISALVHFLAGCSIAVLAGIGYFWARGILGDLCYANFLFPIRHYSQVGSTPYGFGLGTHFWGTFGSLTGHILGFPIAFVLWTPFALVFLLPAVLVAIGIFRRSSFTEKTLPYWIAGSALWLSELHRPDLIHLVMASPVFMVLLFSFVSRAFIRRLLLISAATLASVNLLVCLTAPVRVTTPVGSMALFARNPVIEFTNSHVRPGESIFVYPYSPIYYFLARAVNPTRFSYLIYGQQTPEQVGEAVESIEKDRTRYVIWDTTFEATATSSMPDYRPPPEAERIMEPYLNSRYTEIGRERGIRFLERKMPRTPAPDSACHRFDKRGSQ